jgi:hypothetical protein
MPPIDLRSDTMTRPTPASCVLSRISTWAAATSSARRRMILRDLLS